MGAASLQKFMNVIGVREWGHVSCDFCKRHGIIKLSTKLSLSSGYKYIVGS